MRRDRAGGRRALEDIFAAPVRERIARAKYLTIEDLAEFDRICDEIGTQLVSQRPAAVEEVSA